MITPFRAQSAARESAIMVFVALALNETPVDVLSEQLATTRGALYKTLHDARRKLRDRLVAEGHLAAVPAGDRKEGIR